MGYESIILPDVNRWTCISKYASEVELNSKGHVAGGRGAGESEEELTKASRRTC